MKHFLAYSINKFLCRSSPIDSLLFSSRLIHKIEFIPMNISVSKSTKRILKVVPSSYRDSSSVMLNASLFL